jgi:D-inositol-3-phosphate glycosyltransferase
MADCLEHIDRSLCKKKHMQIAMISYWSCPLARLGVASAGGLNVYVMNLAQTLGELGHEVDVYTRQHPASDDIVYDLHPNVAVLHIRQCDDDLYDDVYCFADAVVALGQQHGRQYEVIHAHYFYSGLVGLALRERFNAPLVETFHTLGIMKKYVVGTEDQRRIGAETRIIAQVDAIVASTELEKMDLIRWHDVPEAKIHTVHPGVDHHIFQPYGRQKSRELLGIEPDDRIIVFVGRIDPIKGIDILVDAFARLDRCDSSTKLLLIGGDPDNKAFWQTPEGAQLQRQIREHQLEGRVLPVGSQPQEQIARYFSAADLVVMPSAYETFGFVALEAMACAACVVASRVGGLQYLIEDGVDGRLVEQGNVEELAAVMDELLADQPQRERLGREAFAASYRYCWSIQAEKMISVYTHAAQVA